LKAVNKLENFVFLWVENSSELDKTSHYTIFYFTEVEFSIFSKYSKRANFSSFYFFNKKYLTNKIFLL